MVFFEENKCPLLVRTTVIAEKAIDLAKQFPTKLILRLMKWKRPTASVEVKLNCERTYREALQGTRCTNYCNSIIKAFSSSPETLGVTSEDWGVELIVHSFGNITKHTEIAPRKRKLTKRKPGFWINNQKIDFDLWIWEIFLCNQLYDIKLNV